MATMTEARDLTIIQAAWNLRRKSLSAEELVLSCLKRIDERDLAVNAWVYKDPQAALRQARWLDSEAAHERWHGFLHGIPLGIKDVIDVANMPTRAGCEAYPMRVADTDAEAVGRLRASGAIILGKTVTTPFAGRDPMATRNPWDLSRSPGGSSSGSGAAVADRMCLAALGTQSGGSVLRPAAFCGVTGFKPSSGQTSLRGVVPNLTDLDHLGVIARDAADAHGVFSTMRDAPWAEMEANPSRMAPGLLPEQPLRLWRMGGFYRERCSEATWDIFESHCAQLEDEGVVLVEKPLPSCFEGIHEAHRNISSALNSQFAGEIFASNPELFPTGLANMMEKGRLVSAVAFLKAQAQRRGLREEMAHLLGEVDGAIMPVAPEPPPSPDTTGDGVLLAPWSVSGLPALSVPAGLDGAGLPTALQIIAAPGEDQKLLRQGLWLESVFGFHQKPA